MTTTIQQLKDFEGQEVTLNGWVYNTHVHSSFDGMEQKGGVHGLTNGVVPPKGEGYVTHTTTNAAIGQVLLYPSSGLYKIGTSSGRLDKARLLTGLTKKGWAIEYPPWQYRR